MIKGTRRCVSALLGALLIAALNVAPAAATNGTVWTTLPGLPTARGTLSAVTAPCPAGQTGNCVYALGGTPDLATTVLATAESFNPRTNAWTTVAPMPSTLLDLAAAAAPCPAGQTGTCVYAIGGSATLPTGFSLSSVYSYNPATNAWSTDASMLSDVDAGAAVAAGCRGAARSTCIYVVGGLPNGATQPSLAQSYNPATNTWSFVASMPTPRWDLSAAAAPCHGAPGTTCVYAIGGFNYVTPAGGGTAVPETFDTTESYNPATNTWSEDAPSLSSFQLGAASSAPCPPGQSGTCVYSVGGENNAGLAPQMESFNPTTNAWTTLTLPPTTRWQLAAATDNCPPGETGMCVYAIGGFVASGPAVGTVEALDPPLPGHGG